MRGDFNAVTIPAVHSELLHVEVVRKGEPAGLIANSRVFGVKYVTPPVIAAPNTATHRQLPRKPQFVREEVGHRSVGVSGFAGRLPAGF
jgi:hypothetical protein